VPGFANIHPPTTVSIHLVGFLTISSAQQQPLTTTTSRFSLSWPRILPQGGKGTKVNPAGIWFYTSLLKELRTAGITPVITL